MGPDLVWIAGSGSVGALWREWQTPAFDAAFRSTTFDNRGVGATRCDEPEPWTISDFARDTAALIEAVCDPPVVAVGHSLGGFIVTQLALDHPALLSCAIASGTAAQGHKGWLGDYMRAEVELRRRGGHLEGMFSAAHYAALLYPARVLGDRNEWERIKITLGVEEAGWADMIEKSFLAHFEPCLDWDVSERLPTCSVALHVIAFGEDVAAPPQDGEEVAALAQHGEFHLLEGMGHGSMYGHTHDAVNACIREIAERYV